MKIISTFFLMIIILGSTAVAQTPGYYLIYGNRNGSTIDVYLDSDIEIEAWFATPLEDDLRDLDCNGIVDSINFIHIPLASNDSIIVSRDGGEYYYPLDYWDDVNFLPPDTNSPIFGYTSQSLYGFADIIGGYNPLLNTEGDSVLLFTLYMHTTSDTIYLDQSVCPFQEGFNIYRGCLLCGMQDGSTPIIPFQTFGCLHFVHYLAGDANGSVNVNGLDVIYLVNFLNGTGPPPDPILLGDANGDCSTNGLDVIYLVNYFKGPGPPPVWGNCP